MNKKPPSDTNLRDFLGKEPAEYRAKLKQSRKDNRNKKVKKTEERDSVFERIDNFVRDKQYRLQHRTQSKKGILPTQGPLKKVDPHEVTPRSKPNRRINNLKSWLKGY
tara:strand:+ start:3511 stop:3834 length:324 start_codon:yes stop_codon:yes gene_type:complete